MEVSVEELKHKKQFEENMEKKRQKSLADYQNMFCDYVHLPQIKIIIERFKYFQDISDLFDIFTTRFDSYTYQQNQRFKESIIWKGEEHGSLYSTTTKLPVSASKNKYLFILDMNNTTNKIMGIGFIKNLLAKEQELHVYDNPCFNNYIYKSQYYLSLVDNNIVPQNSKSSITDFIIDEFELRLFFGKSHLKRGGGYTRFPYKWMKFKHLRFLLTLFAIHNPNHFNSVVLGL